VDIALKFDSIDVATTMSRVLRRQMMVVKGREGRGGGRARPQMWMDVHFDKFFLSFGVFFFVGFFLHMLALLFFFLLNLFYITNISVRTTQIRAHIYIHDRSSCTIFLC
jgi:hypothetical protein